MPTIEIDVEIWCSCGEGLCRQSSAGRNGHSEYITVEPCEKCLEKARDEGKDEGYQGAVKEFEKEE